MPRKARVVSKSGIYHVLLRSFNGEIIFKDGQDTEKFLDVLESYKETCGFKIYAWCMLAGHIHLLMQTGDMPLGDIFKRVGGKFVYWYNQKYSRQGPLFQDRYKSEPVESDKNFLMVVRFIHRNPIHHELCDSPAEYSLSSYSAYTDGEQGLVDTEYLLSKMTKVQFIKLVTSEGQDEGLDIESPKRMNDEQ
ncbi:MAG: transposase, partial [Oscillospiraceae bacterium]